MRAFRILWIVGWLAICVPAFAAEKAAYDSNGRIIALLPDGEDFEVSSNLVAVLPSGKRVPLQVRREGAGAVRRGDGSNWTSPFALPDGGRGRMELQSQEDASGLRYSAMLSAETDLTVDAIEFVIDVPRLAFLKGRVIPDRLEPVALGPVKPPDPALFRGEAAGLRFEDATGQRTLSIGFDQTRSMAVVDRWDASGRSYQLRTVILKGPWGAGTKSGITATLRLDEKPESVAPAHLTVDTSKPLYGFQGFGGNYCWDNRSPITAYTLKNLKISWARTAMNLVKWDKYRGAGRSELRPALNPPGPDMRADLEVMRQLHQEGVPYVISVWSIPERFYTDPYEKPPSAHSRVVSPEKWDELLDLIGSYLLYAKREYSTEPDLFSFNETDIGINVGSTPASYDQSLRRIGAYLHKLGLKTKILLGDTGGARDTHKFALEAASDPEVAPFLGAVGFHSWNGAAPGQYGEWSSLAEWLNLPLLVTELGVDPSAYYTRAWNSYDYGLREARMTQELFSYAHPQGMLFWQFTNDYALARVRPDGLVEPSSRFWLMKHFTDLTPPQSDALATSSDQPNVLFTAFHGSTQYTFHILNLGATRDISIQGAPDADWQIKQTTETAPFQSGPAIRSSGGMLKLDVPSRSLVSLTATTGQKSFR